MKISKNKIAIILTFTVLFTILGFTYSENRKKNRIANSSTDLSMDNKNTNAPIIIYNSHPDEEYNFGKKVIDVGKIISDNLRKEKLNSTFIEITAPKSYTESYSNSRKAIKDTATDYNKSILLDIHRQASNDSQSNNRSIVFTLCKNSPNYDTSRSFADSLIKEINNAGKIKADVFLFNNGINYFNQDLAKNSLVVEIGSEKSTTDDINACINALTSALKKVTLTLLD